MLKTTWLSFPAPCSSSLLVFQLYLLALICFPIFDGSCSSSKASLAPSFHVHSSHILSSRKNFLLLHTPACSSFLVSTLLVLALHGESVLVPAQVSLPHSYYPFCWDVEVAAWKEQNCNTCLLHLPVHTVLSLMWL